MAASNRIIGMGNEYRRDDGVGRCVIQLLRERGLAGVDLLEQSGEGASLMEAMQGADSVYLIDAVASSNAPGRVHRLDAARQRLPAEFFHYSSHAFSLAEAVELARALGQLPPRVIVYGIEGADFGSGVGLSDPVRSAADRVVESIIQELNEPCTSSPSSPIS